MWKLYVLELSYGFDFDLESSQGNVMQCNLLLNHNTGNVYVKPFADK